MLAVFLYTSIGFCNEAGVEDNESDHCIEHCVCGGQAFMSQKGLPLTASYVVSTIFPPDYTRYQNSFIRDIYHPPKIS